MSDDRSEARDSDAPEAPEAKPEGLPDAVSEARAKTPGEKAKPIGLMMTPSMRLKLELVPEHDEDAEEQDEEPARKKKPAKLPFDRAECRVLDQGPEGHRPGGVHDP